MNIDDDDCNSFSSSTNTDDDMDDLSYNTHRACSRYTPCNNKKHQHLLTDLTTSKCLSNNSKPIKGAIRSVDNELGYRQQYDGSKWRRICSKPNCLIYLNGGVFYKNWLCRKHYVDRISKKSSTVSNNLIIDDTEMNISKNKKSQRSSTHQSPKRTKLPLRGDIMTAADGSYLKYNGKAWRPVCTYIDCKSYLVTQGYCHRHYVEIRKKKSDILSFLNDTQQPNLIPEVHTTRSAVSSIEKPKKGDIQSIRQLWNGTKWYSLCQYHVEECTRRSGGIKRAYLCDIHYREYIKQPKTSNSIPKNNSSSTSPIVKRKRSINNDNIRLSASTDRSYQGQSTITQTQQTEQCIQTDLTYPLESKDLRHGCFLIDDDNTDNQCQTESSQLMVYIKKEDESCLSNKRKLTFDVNSLPINCKLEITKLEL